MEKPKEAICIKTQVLFKSKKGVTFERTDGKRISRVKVKTDSYTIGTYKFKYVEGLSFKSPFISYENLNSCGGWDWDNEYLKTAVQNGKKLCAGIKFEDYNEMSRYVHNLDKNKYTFVEFYTNDGTREICELNVARKGSLSDYYELYDILDFYSAMDFPLGKINPRRFEEFFNCEIRYLLNGDMGFNYRNNLRVEDYMITGLLLGYPLESTISSIYDVLI
jgi:hypothetical protein